MTRDCLACGQRKHHHARGLCMACWHRARRRGQLDRYPRTFQSITPREPAGDTTYDLFLEDLDALGFNPHQERKPQFRRLAIEMGIKAESLERRWQRAQRRMEAA